MHELWECVLPEGCLSCVSNPIKISNSRLTHHLHVNEGVSDDDMDFAKDIAFIEANMVCV